MIEIAGVGVMADIALSNHYMPVLYRYDSTLPAKISERAIQRPRYGPDSQPANILSNKLEDQKGVSTYRPDGRIQSRPQVGSVVDIFI
jgi:hypothetical protein